MKNFPFKILIALCLLWIGWEARAQTEELYFRTKQPEVPAKCIVFLMHGYGSNENDLWFLTNYLPKDALVLSLRAPKTIGPEAYGWYSVDFSTGKPVINEAEAEQARKNLIGFVERTLKKYNMKGEQAYFLGFSQGAIQSLALGLTRPDLAKGIVPIAGRLLPEIERQTASAQALKHLQVLLLHGTEDKVLPIDNGKHTLDFLQQKKVKVEAVFYPNTGHSVNNEMLAKIQDWFSSR